MKSKISIVRICTFLCVLGLLLNSGAVFAQGEGEPTPTSNTAPTIILTEPQQNITIQTGEKVSIAWTDDDPDDSALVSLAYDVDSDLTNDDPIRWIAQNLPEDSDEDGDRFEWDTTGIPAGTYYLWAVISDSVNAPTYALAAGTLTILEAQSPTQEPTTVPTEEPTTVPTEEPTTIPTVEPTAIPTQEPTQAPTVEPTQTPTDKPKEYPTYQVGPYLSQDGLTLYNAVAPLVIYADPNPDQQNIRVPQSDQVAAAIADPSSASATFSITYATAGQTDPWGASCLTFPESAKTAFNAAAAIWANTIQSSVPITIFACWSNLGSSTTLGYSGGQPLHRDFSGAPLSGTWYQGSLANSLYGSDLSTSSYDDYITYNSNFSWYYGTDGNTPSGYYDLVTVAAHEIAHGLNFSGSASYSGGTGSYKNSGYPVVYDTFVEDGSGNKLSAYTNPSTALGSLFTSNNLWFDGTNADAANGGSRVKLYAPSTWSSGSSFAHLDYSTFAGTSNSMMVYAVAAGSSQHNPGTVTVGLLKDMGWALAAATTVPTPISPSGTINDTTPTYTWSKISSATNYQFQVYKGSSYVYAYTVSASTYCGSTNCSVTPTPVLSAGSYQWRIRAYIGGTWQEFSSYKAFTLAATPTTISPSGNISDTTPTYTWSKVSGATNYQYQLYKGSSYVYGYTVSSSACGTSTCSSTPTPKLSHGAYQWRVRAYVGGAWQPLSAFKAFSVIVIPSTGTPTGTISDTTPTYLWSKISGATNYQYQLYKGSTFVYSKTVSSSACGTSTCTNTPTTVLSNGSYQWRVRAYVNGAWQAFSAYKSFTLAIGFNSQFSSNASGWAPVNGSWSVASGSYQTTGVNGSFASSRYNAYYSTYTYQVRLYRSGDIYSSYGILFNGTPTPLGTTGRWNKGYGFYITKNGSYTIGSYSGGAWTSLVDWTYSSAISSGWNILKVTYNSLNSYTQFFINGTRVAYGYLYSYKSGVVGVAMYQSDSASRLYVDYAVLSTSAPSAMVSDSESGIVIDENQPINVTTGKKNDETSDMKEP